MVFFTGMLKLKLTMVLQIQTLCGFPSIEVGDDDGLTIIVRDRAQEDKVVKVIEPLDTVYLTFDWNDQGRLHYIRTEWDNYRSVGAVSQLHKLYYEPYLTSYGEIESVLTKVRQITKVTKEYMDGVKVTKLSAENEQIYKSIYKELSDMDKINAQRVAAI
jgi:hypothetical protein